jgi:hypothetical protein
LPPPGKKALNILNLMPGTRGPHLASFRRFAEYMMALSRENGRKIDRNERAKLTETNVLKTKKSTPAWRKIIMLTANK